jgi:hypothetical protein
MLPPTRSESVVPPRMLRVSEDAMLRLKGTVRLAVLEPIVTFSLNEKL